MFLNCNNCAPCATSGTGLEWALNGDIINLYFGEQLVLKYKILEVNETTFTYLLEIDYDDDGSIDQLEITGISYDPYDEFNE